MAPEERPSALDRAVGVCSSSGLALSRFSTRVRSSPLRRRGPASAASPVVDAASPELAGVVLSWSPSGSMSGLRSQRGPGAGRGRQRPRLLRPRPCLAVLGGCWRWRGIRGCRRAGTSGLVAAPSSLFPGLVGCGEHVPAVRVLPGPCLLWSDPARLQSRPRRQTARGVRATRSGWRRVFSARPSCCLSVCVSVVMRRVNEYLCIAVEIKRGGESL